jgi:hypothetical protein
MVFVTRELIGIVCVLSSVCFGQVTGPTGPDTAYAPCLEGQVGVRSYQSPVLVSPDGLWRAYANVEGRSGGDVGCSNISTLQIQNPTNSAFEVVHTVKPEPYLQGNGLKLVSWSLQRHLLVIEVSVWQYASDAGGNSMLVYDADRKRTIEPDLARLFAQRCGKKECTFVIGDVLGFDSRNRVLFSADDRIDPGDGEPVPETRCIGRPSVWALDVDSSNIDLVQYSKPDQ